MANLSDDQVRRLCLDLLKADGEQEVVDLLRKAGFWEDHAAWRLYGDKEGNFAAAGNQQALPEAALVEKIVNSCDSRLMAECVLRGIGPESPEAPNSVRDAVAMFFENRRVTTDEGGTLANWTGEQRSRESRNITIAVTGDRPTRGHRTRRMCISITDQAEGQSPLRLPKTILSLNEKNKQRIRFVQGKFNMGGSGVLRFCGSLGLQLVISRRHPDLAKREKSKDATVDYWGVTVVRREEPSNKSGDPVHSEFTYLAPIGSKENPRNGEVLRFSADTLPLLPEHDEPYSRKAAFGTLIKLYEYQTTVGQSNVILPDGLTYSLERLLPEIALPVRIHECRGYKGDKERSFEHPLAGLVVRLEEGKGDNLEPGFPISESLNVRGMKMTARIYAFKEDRAKTYLQDEGVIFAINGQAHGYLPKSIFTRPKAVGLTRLRDSLLVLVDCSRLTTIQREDLFMSSRDRLSKMPIRYEVEEVIERLLKEHPQLRRLQNERRERDVKDALSDDKPLEDVLKRIFSSSPTLRALFLKGERLKRPFAKTGGKGNGSEGGTDSGEKPFVGKRHPTYFRVPNSRPGAVYQRNCERTRNCRITFETDVENAYFSRPTDSGTFELVVEKSTSPIPPPNYSIALDDGRAHLNMSLPVDVEVGDVILLRASVSDSTLMSPFVSNIELTVIKEHVSTKSDKKAPNRKHAGAGNDAEGPQGIVLPRSIMVRENDDNWKRHKFNEHTSCHVESDLVSVGGAEAVEHVFYINADNSSLRTEIKETKQDPRLLEAKFRYANVLLGAAMIHDAELHSAKTDGESRRKEADSGRESVQDSIRRVSGAVAPVMIPIIDQLSGLDAEAIVEESTSGEDA